MASTKGKRRRGLAGGSRSPYVANSPKGTKTYARSKTRRQPQGAGLASERVRQSTARKRAAKKATKARSAARGRRGGR